MPVTITKPQATLRELLAGLKKRTGLFGEQVLRTENVADFYGIIGQNRNRIINGGIIINQRAFNASITDTGALTYTADRWGAYGSVASKFSVQQTTGTGDGFSNSLLATSSSSYTVGASEIFKITQVIEGYNIADLSWGSTTAKTVTLSFWVKCSLSGTFGGVIINSAFNRNYPFAYTISSANTWEQKTITIPGDTSGTWLATNGIGMQLIWSLGTGSSSSGSAGAWGSGNIQSATGAASVVATSGATWQITGVQLERGAVATPFEHRSYGQELALCQRYCTVYGGNSVYEHLSLGAAYSTSGMYGNIFRPIQMRTNPSVSYSGNWCVTDGITNTAITSFGFGSSGAENSNKILTIVAATGGTSLTQFRPLQIMANNDITARYIVSAEL